MDVETPQMTNIESIRNAYVGESVRDIPTPSFVINKAKLTKNCETLRKNMKVLEKKANINLKFRPHVKTHKTVEGLLIQLNNGDESNSVLVSTLAEAEYILSDPRCNKVVKEICYTLPIAQNNFFMDRLIKISSQVKLILFIDHLDQLKYLQNCQLDESKQWNVFLKIDVGTQRAGVDHNNLTYIEELFKYIKAYEKVFDLYGIYAHAGHSYGCTNQESVNSVLLDELKFVVDVAKFVSEKEYFDKKLVLSIGGTPTIKAIENGEEDFIKLVSSIDKQKFELELHCGNYCMLDLQQASTSVSKVSDIACYVKSQIVSNYPSRNESLCNAGVLALTRETSTYKGHGTVFELEQFLNTTKGIEISEDHCCIDRISQEHGIIKDKIMDIGEEIAIIPQHACIVAACHPFFVVTNDKNIIVDIWVPCKGW